MKTFCASACDLFRLRYDAQHICNKRSDQNSRIGKAQAANVKHTCSSVSSSLAWFAGGSSLLWARFGGAFGKPAWWAALAAAFLSTASTCKSPSSESETMLLRCDCSRVRALADASLPGCLRMSARLSHDWPGAARWSVGELATSIALRSLHRAMALLGATAGRRLFVWAKLRSFCHLVS